MVEVSESTREVLLTRRTCHRFAARSVPDVAVRRALDCAVRAPNHKLTSPWKFFLLGRETASAVTRLNTELLVETKGEKAAEHRRKRWLEMPGWLVVTCRVSSDEIRQQEDYAACACAVHAFMLSLWSEGIASKWSTGPVTRDPRMLDILGLPAGEHFVVALVWYGYPGEEPQVVRDGPEAVTRALP